MERRLDPRPKGRADQVDCSEPNTESTSHGPPPDGCRESSSSLFVNPAELTLPSPLVRAPPAYIVSGAVSSSMLQPPNSASIAQHQHMPLPKDFSSPTHGTYPSSGYSEPTSGFSYQIHPSLACSVDEKLFLPQLGDDGSTFGNETGTPSVLTMQDHIELASARYGVGLSRPSNAVRALEQTYSSSINYNNSLPFGHPISIMSPSGPVNTSFHEALSAEYLQDQRKRKPGSEEVSMHSQKRWRDILPKDYPPSDQAHQPSSFGLSPIEVSSSQLDVALGPMNSKFKNCMRCRMQGSCCKNRTEASKCMDCQKAFEKIVDTPSWRESIDLDSFAFFDQDMDQRFFQFCSSVNSQHVADAPFNAVDTCHIELHSGPYPNQLSKHDHLIQRSSALSSKAHLHQPVFDRAGLNGFMVNSVFASSLFPEKFYEVNHGAIAVSLQILTWLSILRNADRMNFYFEQGFSAHEAKAHALNIFHSILWAVDEKLTDFGGRINIAAGLDEADWEVYFASELLCASIKKHGKREKGCKSPELGVLDIFWEHVEKKASTIRSSLSRRRNAYGVWFCTQTNSPCLQRYLELRTWQKTFKPVVDIIFAKYRKDRPSQSGVATLMAQSFAQVLEAKTSALEASIETFSKGLGKESTEQEQHSEGSTSQNVDLQKPWLGDFLRSSPEPFSGRDGHAAASNMSSSDDTFRVGSWVGYDDLSHYFEDPDLGYIPNEIS